MTSKKLLYNLNLTDNLITLGNLNSNNITTTNISTSSLSISGNVSFNSITIPNAVFTNVSSGSITATSSTISNSVFTNISTSSLLALGNTNTIGSIITTGGNVGINTINPTSRLDVNGTINANTYTGGSISISGILNSNTISSNVISASTITGGNLYLSNNVFIGGTLTTVNITTTNLVDVTISSGSVYANNITSTNIVGTTISSGTILGTTLNVNGNVTMASNVIIGGPTLKIPTGNIAARPSVPESGYVRYNSETQQFEGYGPGNAWGSLGGVIDIAQTTKVLASATPSTTDGNLYFLTVNSERMRINSTGNIGIGTSTPTTTLDVSGTFRATTSVTSGALYATNLTSTNIVGTTISSGTILGTTLVSSANVSASIITAGTLVGSTISGTNLTSTNIVGTTISSGTILGTTLISSANVSASIVTAGTLVGSTISGTNGTITNIVGTTISAGTILGTTLVSSANVSASLITVGNIRATSVASTIIAGTTITGGSIYASGDLFVGGTITTVNITSTNLVETNVSAGVVLASTLLSAPGNSNTLGSIITTGGNVGIGSASPSSKLHVHGGILASTNTAISYQGIHLQWNRSNAEGESWIINQKGGGNANSGIRFGRADTSNNVTELMRILDSGNVGIATNSPAYTFDVSGTARFTNTSATCMGTLIIAGPGSTTSLPATTTIGQLMSLYGPGGANVISNIDLSTFIPSAAAMNLPGVRFSMQDLGANNSSFNILTKNSGNTGTMASRIFIDGSGNVGINTSSPGTTLDVSGTFRATTSVTSGALYATNSTVTNIVGTTISTGTLLGSTINGTNSTITNAVHTALSTGTLNATTSIASAAINATNVTATNIVGTTISAGTILGTTLLSSANVSASVVTAGTLVGSTINGTNSTITNAVHTAVSTGTLEASGSISQYGAAASNYNGYLKTNNSGQASTTLLNPGIILFNQSGTYNYGMDMGSTAGGRFRTRIFAPDTADIAFSFAPAAGATSQSGFTDRVVISGSGNMGIGTVTPLAELNVQGDASGTYASDSGQIIISGSTNSNKRLGIALDTNNNVGILQAGLSGTTTYPIALNPGGSNVGINTTSPGTTLDVSGTFRATTSVTSAALFATNVTATNIVSTIISSGNIRATTAISTGTLVASTLVSTANLAASNITVGTSLSALGSSNTLGSIITIGGGVGIGTSSLDLGAKLQISGGSVVTNMNNVGVEIGGTGTVGYLTTNTNHPLSFAAFGPTAMTIYTSGNIGINNLSARSKLEISPSAVDYHSTKLINDYALSLTYPLSTMGTLGIAFGITSVTAPNTTLTPGAAILFERLNSSTLSGALHFCTKAGTGANNSPNLIRMTIQTSGNIGIGTTSPSAKLELSDSTGSSNAPFIKLSGAGGAGNQVGIKLNPWSGRSGGDSSQIIAVDDGSASSHLTFYTASGDAGTSTERMRITNSGYVGIGTTAPATPLEVVASGSGIRQTSSGCSVEMYTSSTDAWIQTSTNNSLSFAINNGTNMTINTNGNIGIGTTSPSVLTKLQVLGKVGIGETDTTNNGRGTLDIKPAAVDYHSTKLMADYALTLSYNAATNGSLGIGFGISATGSITPGASIIFERTASTNVGLLHFCTKSGTAATAANLIRMTVQTSGNVGIGTTAPTSTLQINGSLAKTSGTFDIKHPIVADKRLVHSFIEGPRCDLIYRGKVTLQNGQATVNLDSDCVQEQGSAMTQGTFEALCANPDYYLQNNSSFDRVKGSISGNILTIICENSSSTDKISWMIVAERKDEGIKEWDRTNSSGYLITEYSS